MAEFGVGDIVRYRTGTALYVVTKIENGGVRLLDMGTGLDWGGPIDTDRLALVENYAALYERNAPDE